MFSHHHTMKSFRLLPVLLAVLVSVSMLSCKKSNVLPEVTQEGRNTFGCRLNGQLYLPKKDPPIRAATNFRVTLSSINLEIDYLIIASSRDRTENLGTIWLSYLGAKENLRIGVFPILTEQQGGFSFKYDRFGTVFTVDTERESRMEILRFDREARIVSGTFACSLVNPLTGERVEVTEGRFDVKLY